MSKKIGLRFLATALLISLSAGFVASVQAQGGGLGPTPTPGLTATPTIAVNPTATAMQLATQLPNVFPADSNLVSFTLLHQGDLQLVGPFDSNTFTFAIPADWKLTSGAKLDLAIAVSSNTTLLSQANQPGTLGGSLAIASGTLTVFFNNVLLGVLPFNKVGEIQTSLIIPDQALVSPRQDGRMLLNFILDSRHACTVNQQMNIAIHTSSHFTFPHGSIQLPTSLANFPRPIYQGTFKVDSAILVVPDHPSALQLQEALTVAAGLGNLSGNSLAMDMTTLSNLTPAQKLAAHVIFVGPAPTLPILEQLQLPLSPSNGQFQIAGGGPEDGLIQMINSPWSTSHVVLVISGNSDQGTIKAAQAIGTGVLLPNLYPNVSVIQTVQTTPVTPAQPVDQTLINLGFSGRLFNHIGVDTSPYTFFIPPGSTVTPDAHFELIFGNSELLNYSRSGLVVLLNGIPIGSVRMSDTTASQPTNSVLISIPPSAVVPGINRLDVQANLTPIDDCSPLNFQGLWVQVWPQSILHLPLNRASLSPVANLDLASLPAPFVYSPTLATTAFVLAPDDLQSWRAALQIASYLAASANGPLTALSVFYGNQLPQSERSKYNMLIIGQPSQMPIVQEMNNSLPVPFSSGNDLTSTSNSQVTYRISKDSPMGYIEMLPSPWNPDDIVLAVLGNTPQGVGWASSALIDPILRSHIAGNFDVVNDRQILTSVTRISSIPAGVSPTPGPGIAVVPPTNGTVPTAIATRPSWLLPVLVVTLVLILLILAFVAIRSWSRNRNRKPR